MTFKPKSMTPQPAGLYIAISLAAVSGSRRMRTRLSPADLDREPNHGSTVLEREKAAVAGIFVTSLALPARAQAVRLVEPACNQTMRVAISLAFVVVAVLAAPSQVAACMCGRQLPTFKAFDPADAVFIASAMKAEPGDPTAPANV
jgi:hypothetical protein